MTPKPLPVEHLTPPKISEKYIKQKITAIRPMREGCIHISAEAKKGKWIIHDYGHGGSGYALLLGSVNEALREFEDVLEKDSSLRGEPICVIGAGCIGLMTAVTLAEKGYRVRIIAKAFDHIVSNYAGGTSWLVSVKMDPEHQEKMEKIALESWEEYVNAIENKHPFLSSNIAKFVPVYCSLGDESGLERYVEKGIIEKPTEVLIDFGGGKQHHVLKYKAIFINTTAVMEELQAKVEALEIPFLQKEIKSFEEIEETLIFNCTGLGAKLLNQDDKVIPVQGHLLSLKDQPPMEELQYMIYAKVKQRGKDVNLYYMLKSGSGCVGGTFIEGEDGLDTNSHEFDLLIERSREYFGGP